MAAGPRVLALWRDVSKKGRRKGSPAVGTWCPAGSLPFLLQRMRPAGWHGDDALWAPFTVSALATP